MKSSFENNFSPQQSDEVTPEFMQLFDEAFSLYDKEGNGTLEETDLKHLLRCFEKDFDE